MPVEHLVTYLGRGDNVDASVTIEVWQAVASVPGEPSEIGQAESNNGSLCDDETDCPRMRMTARAPYALENGDVAMNRGKNCKVYDGATLFDNVVLGDNVTIFPGAVIGRPPLSTGATKLRVTWDSLPPVKIGNNCVIGANATVYADVQIGDNSMVCDTACIREQCRIGCFCVIAQGVTINYNTTIGNHVRIMDNTHLTGNMVVEDSVFVGPLVATANDNSMGRNVESYQPIGPTIRKFARIGQGSCILPGVEIGENAIVGSSSLVTKNVAPRTVVMGVPARFIRNATPEEVTS